jgi:ABC-type transporter Mla MlaB component
MAFGILPVVRLGTVLIMQLESRRPRRPVMFRIEKSSNKPVTVLRLSGYIRSEHLAELKEQIDSVAKAAKTVLNLEELRLVDRAAVHFLGCCEADGIELVDCPLYVREWITQERNRDGGSAGAR